MRLLGWGSCGSIMASLSHYLLQKTTFAKIAQLPLAVPSHPPCPTTASSSLKLDTFQFETVRVNEEGKVIERLKAEAKYYREVLDRKNHLDMIFIPGGTFMMGASPNETAEVLPEREMPQHEVHVAPFFMSKYPVTRAQWVAIMKAPAFEFPGDTRKTWPNHPVDQITYEDAVILCDRLSQVFSREYRLPSEAEWEYACRAGTQTPFYFGETITTELANFDGTTPYNRAPKGTYRQETTEVGLFPPNAFGLYDMHGNVVEFCLDGWHDNYKGAPTDGSAWVNENEPTIHVIRGGYWASPATGCRSACRSYSNSLPGRTHWDVQGCRLVFSA